MAGCDRCGAEIPRDAHFCPSCGAPVSADRPSEERKLATVMFADLVGSTALAGAEDPERTRVVLDRFYDAMAEEVERAGGTIEKFAGDAVMAAFGAPTALEDHAERALHAALAMQRRLAQLFEGRLELRIGVNTGEVVVGRPREGSSFVTGDAVNVAGRLEQAATPGRILAGERTVAAARDAFEFEQPMTVEAKGKPEGVVARRLVRALSLMRPRGVAGVRRAFVGREAELKRLWAAYRSVLETGAPHLVTVMGEAGVGKTRLVRELWERLGGESPDPVRRTGRCLPYGRGIAYWPLGEILKEHLGILESDPPEAALRRLEGYEILGRALGLDVAGDLHPLVARERFHDGWTEFLERLVAEQPGVVLVEDLHWAEEPLLELLEHLIHELTGPLLLLVTSRPELLDRRPGWGRQHTLLSLEPLRAEDSQRLLDELLGTTVPTALQAVVERAEGNPFFVEELLATVIDRGLVEQDNGGWTIHEPFAEFRVPDSIQALLASRIDLLDSAEKQALQAAAVIGRIFWSGPVYELLEDVHPDLRVLEERDFIRRRHGSSIAGEREYAIKHALTREVAYGGLPKAKRARLHAAFAAWIERTGAGRDEHAFLLAHHYAEAVRPEHSDLAWLGKADEFEHLRSKAIGWLRRAADLALGRYEIDEGIGLLHRALELERDGVARAELWRTIGHANALKLDGEGFWTAMLKALEACPARTASAEAYSELAFHTATRSAMWKRRPDPELVHDWIEHALELTEPDTPARTRALIAQSWYEPTMFADAAQDASALAERVDDPDLRSWALAARSRSAYAAGAYEDAAGWSERRLALVPEIGDPDHVAFIYFYALDPYIALGRFPEARLVAAAQEEVTRDLTAHHRLHGIAGLLVVENAAACWKDIQELRTRAEQAVAANVATPCIYNSWSLLACALAEEWLGNPVEARRLERDTDALGMEGYEYVLDPLRIRLALARGNLDEVERKLAVWSWSPAYSTRDVDSLVARVDALLALRRRDQLEEEAAPLLRPGTYLEPFALRALGVVREDESLIEQAVDRFEAIGLTWHAEQSRKLLART
jgi:class 3 adenylate cyclase